MLKSEFQGKDFIEILNPALKDPLVNCKTGGSHGSIQKIYDKDIKGSIFHLDGIPQVTRITIPKDTKLGLGLIQRCIVFQLEIKHGLDFSMEISASDLNQNKRNLLFSTSHKELNVQPLSARIPIKCINRGQWTNLVIDVASFISDIWKNQTFKIIDSITVCANCKLRKIFSLRNVPSADIGLLPDTILHQVDFPNGTDSKLQILTLNDIKSNDSVEFNRINSFDLSLSDSNSNSNTKLKNSYKIAFGTKVQNQSNSIEKKSKNDQLKNDIQSEFLRTQRSKSESDNTIKEKSNDDENFNNSSLKQQKLNNQIRVKNNNDKTQRATKSANSESTKSEINGNNSLNFIETKKLPHPPPSTRPGVVSSARKARLSSAKTTQIKLNSTQNEKAQIDNKTNETSINNNLNKNNIDNNSNNSINNNLNESISDLIQALKLNDKNVNNNKQSQSNDNNKTTQLQPKPPIPNNNNNEKANVYSFSSKPKIVESEIRKNQTQTKTYDFRKYISNSPQKQNAKDEDQIIIYQNSINNNVNSKNQNDLFSLSNTENNSNSNSNSNSKPLSIQSLLQQKPIIKNQNKENEKNIKTNNLEVTDSFEVNLLMHLKAEMDEMPQNHESKKTIVKKSTTSKSKSSPDMFENSNISNENTSDRLYNYKVMTNSFETESTTSAIRKIKADANLQYNYQDEMNTTQSGNKIPSSITRDISVMRSFIPSYSPNLMKNEIERLRNDIDSQATDNVSENSEDELNLVFDENLNCYYDPKTSTYYDLKN